MRKFDVITFDCYGTLIDWEAGIGSAVQSAAQAAGVTVERGEIIALHHEIEPTVQADTYRSYRQVLREVAGGIAARLGWDPGQSDLDFLPNSVVSWPPFTDTNQVLRWLKQEGYRLGILSNVDDDLLEGSLRQFDVAFDFVVTAQSVRSYKPAPAHFVEARKLIGEDRWLHAAQSYFHDIAPAGELNIPAFWVNRKRESPPGSARPLAEADTLAGMMEWLRG